MNVSNLKTAAKPSAEARVGLGAVKKGRVEKPMRILLYGVEGIGKSTFAANAPSPIFLGAEDGTAQLDVHRLPDATTWDHILSDISELETGDHNYKTVALDTLDWAEPLCWAHVCKAGKRDSIEDFGFGKGYVAAVDEWRRLLIRLDALRAKRGMHVILLAHSRVATFKNPEGDDFDRYALKLHDKSSGLIKEWCDAVLFAQYETFTHEKDKRVRGISSGSRIVHTQHRAAFDAKNRYSLPEVMPLSWEDFATAASAHTPLSAEKLCAQIDTLMTSLPDANQEQAKKGLVRAAGDPSKLAQLVDWMKGRIQIEQTETTTTKESDK